MESSQFRVFCSIIKHEGFYKLQGLEYYRTWALRASIPLGLLPDNYAFMPTHYTQTHIYNLCPSIRTIQTKTLVKNIKFRSQGQNIVYSLFLYNHSFFPFLDSQTKMYIRVYILALFILRKILNFFQVPMTHHCLEQQWSLFRTALHSIYYVLSGTVVCDILVLKFLNTINAKLLV